MLKKKGKNIVLFASFIVLFSIISYMVFIRKQHYYVSSGIGPICVDQEVQDGYEVIGKFKLKNPRPIPIKEDEMFFIKEKLPAWIKEHYPYTEMEATIQGMSISELKTKIQYVFTILQDGDMIEADIYLLTLYDKSHPINIYIPKALWDDEEFLKKNGYKLGDYILVYPFLDEEWHSNIDNKELYSLGDLW